MSEQTKQNEKIAYIQIPEDFDQKMRDFEARIYAMEQLNNSYRKLNVAICGNCTHLHTVRKSTGAYSSEVVYRCGLKSKREFNTEKRQVTTKYDTIEIDGWCGHHQYEVEDAS